MAVTIVEGWNPLDDRLPVDDNEVFELLTAAVFQARFRPDIVKGRWPSIRRAFAYFDLDAVAAWPEDAWTHLMGLEGMIRNPKKIRATLRNARELKQRSDQSGGALTYFRSFSDDEALVLDIDTWAHYIGAPSIRWFVQGLRGRE